MADDARGPRPTVWRRNERWTGSDVEDSFIMVNADSGRYVALNRTAAAVWEALASPCTQDQLEQELLAGFEVSPDDCHAAVTTLLAEMRALDVSVPGD